MYLYYLIYIVKKNLYFLIVFLLIGCSSNLENSKEVSCPDVFFSSEHKKYISSDQDEINLENISFRAKINNFKFNSKCFLKGDLFQAKLSILFIIYPEMISNSDIKLPIYVTFFYVFHHIFTCL